MVALFAFLLALLVSPKRVPSKRVKLSVITIRSSEELIVVNCANLSGGEDKKSRAFELQDCKVTSALPDL